MSEALVLGLQPPDELVLLPVPGQQSLQHLPHFCLVELELADDRQVLALLHIVHLVPELLHTAHYLPQPLFHLTQFPALALGGVVADLTHRPGAETIGT